MIIKQIRRRTRGGKGVTSTGKEYALASKPYSPTYVKTKGSAKVDLTLSGDMLENMYVSDVSGNDIEISVADEDYGKLRGAEEGVRHRDDPKGPVKLVRRQFFHLSKNDIKAVKNDSLFQRTLERAVKKTLK